MENKILYFDVNQTIFSSEHSKEIWFIGENIVPLELSLADISDLEMYEGCTQIYQFTYEMLLNMYNEHVQYSSHNLDLLFSRFIKSYDQGDGSRGFILQCGFFLRLKSISHLCYDFCKGGIICQEEQDKRVKAEFII